MAVPLWIIASISHRAGYTLRQWVIADDPQAIGRSLVCLIHSPRGSGLRHTVARGQLNPSMATARQLCG